jgi:methionine-S-sulfoxide reductase
MDQQDSTEKSLQDTTEKQTETAMFAAGCFWGVEARFKKIRGVLDTEVGYSGGHVESPGYKQVCTDTTGHAEVVRIVFDPDLVSYDQLLHVFWRMHDFRQVNRQGPDIGTQYRSAIFYYSEKQKQIAEASKAEIEKYPKYKGKVATLIEPAKSFYPAEDYHQDYVAKTGRACHFQNGLP